jgi:2-keto-3-deoxy-L-fuconate dehydrogenase
MEFVCFCFVIYTYIYIYIYINVLFYASRKVAGLDREHSSFVLPPICTALFQTLKAFLPAMLERNSGHVVAISSAAAITPVANELAYSASKAAVSGNR